MYINQITGLPIGGFLSSVLLHLYLTQCEHKFETFDWHRVVAHCHLHMLWESYFSAVRYGHDLHIMSKSICLSCLGGIVQDIYNHKATFEYNDAHLVREELCLTNKFLDMCIPMSFEHISIDMWHQNVDPSCCCTLQNMTKFRFSTCDWKTIMHY